MDPNANIARQRELAKKILCGDGPPEDDENDALELAELVQALDSWLCRGGFKPSGWTAMETAARGRMGHGD